MSSIDFENSGRIEFNKKLSCPTKILYEGHTLSILAKVNEFIGPIFLYILFRSYTFLFDSSASVLSVLFYT